jgi:hypothetical protein
MTGRALDIVNAIFAIKLDRLLTPWAVEDQPLIDDHDFKPSPL